jgi:hypothetical protein
MTKKNQQEVFETEDAPREAYPVQALHLQEDDFILRACDGDYEYVFMATRKRGTKNYKIVEVYPGLAVRHTHARDVEAGDKDLVVPGRYGSIEEVIEVLNDLLLGDLEVEPKQLKADNQSRVLRLTATAGSTRH